MKRKLISLLIAFLFVCGFASADYQYNPFTFQLDYFEPVSGSDMGDLGDVTFTLTATGNLIYRNALGVWVNLPAGANGQALILAAGLPSWGTLGQVYGGTNIDSSGVTDGQLFIGDSVANTFSLAIITGTANQIIVTNGASSITLSTPQDIAAASSPTFTGLTLLGLNTANGIVQTDGAGVLSTSVDVNTATTIGTNYIYRATGTDIPVTDGGAGRSTSTTAYGLLAAGTTATNPHQTLAAGAVTEILIGGGAAALPAWGTDIPTAVTIGLAYIYRAGGTDVAVADGGTNIGSYTTGDLLYASGATTLSQLADVAIGQVFTSGGVGVAPLWASEVGIGIAPQAGTRLLLPLENDAVTPTLAFGDGDTGFYESADDALKLAISQSVRHSFTLGFIEALVGGGYHIKNIATSSTVPVFTPNNDTNTGLGRAAADQLSLIAGGVEGMRIVENTYIAMHLPETTTPTAIANYGAIYPKADNKLYFQDGAGNEHEITTSDAFYGEFYWDNNGNATIIETANTPIAVRQTSTGSCCPVGWTYNAGSTGGITVYADYSGTVAGTVLITSAGHGLATGDYITIRGAANYLGVYMITYVAAGTFYITHAWSGDDGASDWDEGAYLEASTSSDGKYFMSYNISVTEAGGAGSNWVVQVYHTGAGFAKKSISKRKLANNDYGSMAGQAIIIMTVGQRVFLTVQSTGTNTLTIQYGNFIIKRL